MTVTLATVKSITSICVAAGGRDQELEAADGSGCTTYDTADGRKAVSNLQASRGERFISSN